MSAGQTTSHDADLLLSALAPADRLTAAGMARDEIRNRLGEAGTKTRAGRAWIALACWGGLRAGREREAVEEALRAADAAAPAGRPWSAWHAWSQVTGTVDRCPCAACRPPARRSGKGAW